MLFSLTVTKIARQSDGADGGSNNIVTRCKTLEKYSNILNIENCLIQLFVDYGHKVIERDIAEI